MIFLSDLTFAIRQLSKNLGFTVVAVITLGLGIGANTAIFSVLNGVVLRPLDFNEPGRVVRVWPSITFSKSLMVQFQEGTRSFSGMSGFSRNEFSLTGVDEAEELNGGVVSVGHFSLLGIQPFLGRGFVEEEQEVASSQVVVLSHDLWQRRFGGDPEVIGRSIELSGVGEGLRTVVGVMPEGYRPLYEYWDLWVPLTIDPSNFSDYAGTASLGVVARVADGVSIERADVDVRDYANSIREEHTWISDEDYRAAGAVTLRENMFGEFRSRILILLGSVGIVLLIACVNVANLLLARASTREREIGVRMALGALRGRVIRQLLTESAVLGLLGAGVGIFLAVWIIPPLVTVLPSEVPRADLISIDREVLLFTLALSVGAIVLFGLLPALRATGERVHDALKQGLSKASFGSRRQRLRSALVVAEIALSAVLVLGAGLMLKSLWHLQRVDPGLNPEHLVTMRVTPPEARYSDEESVKAYYAQVEERLAAVPGVTQTAMINYLPLSGGGVSMRFFPQESPVPEDELPTYANCRAVSPDYFLTMGIPLVAGRAFESGEGVDPPRVVISRTAADMAWPGEDPIGKQIEVPAGIEEHFTVIGVVDDVHQFSLEGRPRADMYFPYEWWTSSRMYLTIRVAGDPEAQIPILRAAIWSVDRDVPIAFARSMDEVIDGTTADSRLLAILLASFGILALSLGAIGVYGVVSYTVSQSTYEIGLRMALGAAKSSILTRILRRSLLLAGMGVGIGIVGAFAATRVLSRFLFNVEATDPLTFVGVAVLLTSVALLASYLPAHRASRVDPLVAIKVD